MSVLIIGAGICGLWAARLLAESKITDVCTLEKSRGVGGRMATRRTDDSKFDHGAQFYSLRPEMNKLHERWQSAGLVQLWFDRNGTARYNAKAGMTALAKNLCSDLDVRLSEKATQLSFTENQWVVTTESGTKFSARNVLLTSPLPQSLDLLKASGIEFDDDLPKVSYAKALIALYEEVSVPSAFQAENLTSGYVEGVSAAIHSIADQQVKGLASKAAWTVTMSPDFSEKYFDQDESATLQQMILELKKLDKSFSAKTSQLKKWRYSHPLSKAEGSFREIKPGLYLAGDAFGRPSLNGAVESATALASHLIGKHQPLI